jgi:pimeloyl-ACP methyl ester carboxylesterase
MARSADGIAIAYWRSGEGPPLVLVHGTSSDHTRWRRVLPAFEARHTVYAVERRGRGASGDAPGYAIEREFEDVAAVVDAVGEPVSLIGHSYGGVCALEAARLSGNLRALVLYEPGIVQGGGGYTPESIDRLQELVDRNDREAVLLTFFRDFAGVSPRDVEVLRSLPSWQARLAVAHTIPRELRASTRLRFDPARYVALTIPTLLLVGGDSPASVQVEAQTLRAALPNAQVSVLPGQQHVAMDTAPELFAAAVLPFLDDLEQHTGQGLCPS